VRVDDDPRQDPLLFDYPAIEKIVNERCGSQRWQNRLLEHIGHCALVNKCAAAQNGFLGALRAAPAQLAHLQRGLRWLPQFQPPEPASLPPRTA